jgi:cell wall assembly regulator SMI1
MDVRLETILKLVGQSVFPPGETVPAGATPAQIERLENSLGFHVPNELRAWLRNCNGPCIGAGGIAGVETKRRAQDIGSILADHPDWQDHKWLPVAGDGSGNFYLLITNGDKHPVGFVDTMEDARNPAFIVASDLWKFLGFYLEQDVGECRWPFDRGYVVTKDPAILSHGNLGFPWDA